MALPDPPPSLKSTGMFTKCAQEHDARDPVVAYYCRLCAFQKGFAMDASSPEAKSYLNKLMCKLEESKKQLSSNECISSEAVGMAHVEAYALKLFQFAYNRDLAGDFGKATVKSFYTAGVLLDVATTLGNSNEELEKARKYAKWKAIYITQCQKNNEVPVPGPAASGTTDQLPTIDFLPAAPAGQPSQPSSAQPQPSSSSVQPRVPPQSESNWDQEAGEGEDSLDSLPLETFNAAEKHVRYALSALQHQDKNTAIDNLTKALQMLR